jgi:hypothetical protein
MAVKVQVRQHGEGGERGDVAVDDMQMKAHKPREGRQGVQGRGLAASQAQVS